MYKFTHRHEPLVENSKKRNRKNKPGFNVAKYLDSVTQTSTRKKRNCLTQPKTTTNSIQNVRVGKRQSKKFDLFCFMDITGRN